MSRPKRATPHVVEVLLQDAFTYFRANPSAQAFTTLEAAMHAFQAFWKGSEDAGERRATAERFLNTLRATRTQ